MNENCSMSTPVRRVGTLSRNGPGGRLLRPAVACPGCGARPALRITEDAVRDAAHHPAGERLGTYQCHRRRCGVIYDLTAAAYQAAS